MSFLDWHRESSPDGFLHDSPNIPYQITPPSDFLCDSPSTSFCDFISESPKAKKPKKRIKVEQEINKGSNSTVYLVSRDKKKFALKVLPKKTLNGTIKEAEILDRLSNSCYCVKKVDSGLLSEILDTPIPLENDAPCILMEYLENSLISCNRISGKPLRDLFRHLLLALSEIHQRGFVHMDVKPENILVSGKYPNVRVVICDFGNSVQYCNIKRANKKWEELKAKTNIIILFL